MTAQLTPPPELVREWNQNAIGTHFSPYGYSEYIATQAARWGADQELEACVEWLDFYAAASEARDLHAARRPKPPSLAEQALKALDKMNAPLGNVTASRCDTIRRALKRLQELEKGNE